MYGPWQQATWDVSDTLLDAPERDPDVGQFFSRLSEIEYTPTWYALRTDPVRADDLVDRFSDARARRDEVAAARQSEPHARTPTVTHADSLGRPIATVARNKVSNDTTDEFYTTRVVFDIEGNQREVIDAHDRVVVRYQYDMLGARLHQASMEAGERWMLSDVAGKPLYAWDSRGHRFRSEYDVVPRPTASFVREEDNPEAMVGRAVYGESRVEPEAHNLRGQVVEVFDQAGLVTTERYDFKGNPLRSIRQLADTVDVDGKMQPAYRRRVDWSRDVTLKPESYVSHTRYDALGRPTQVVAPHRDTPEANVNVLQPAYNEAGLLERLDVWLERPDVPSVLLDPSSIAPSSVGITNIDYDAKGQRQALKYSNGVSTRYHYDPQTFRLVHMSTEGGHGGRVLQDLHYTFDPAGNITHIRDDAHQEVFFANARVEASTRYRYDALFRLTEATGREHLGQAGTHPHSHNDAPRVGRVGIPHASDGEALGRYLERYLYDAVGNIASVRHIGTKPHNPGWTRNYAYAETSQLEPDKVSNRLTSTTVGRNSAPAVHKYDEHGNMLDMPHLAAMRWNELDQLQMTQRQVVNDTDGTGRHGERTWYVYDGGGQRIRKVTERPDGRIKDERLYLGSFETYREHRSQGEDLVRETLHIMDDTQRIALVETRISGEEKGIPRRQVRYQLANHLGSATLEVDDQARILSYEEYSPYGGTTYQAVRSQLQTPKRYRFTAMERDDESGLNYHSARYYAPWLGRWASADPVGLTRGTNLYNYAGGDPVNRVDPAGTDWEFCNPFTDSECGIDSAAEVIRDYVPENARLGYDMRVGVVKGARDAVVGVKDLAVGAFRLSPVGRVIDPEQWEKSRHTLQQTVSTIADDPGVLWDAIKDPYVKAVDEGRPGEAVGRAVFEVITALAGTKGADKLAKGSKLGTAASKADDVATVASKIDDVAAVANKVDDVATDVSAVAKVEGASASGGGPKALPPGPKTPAAWEIFRVTDDGVVLPPGDHNLVPTAPPIKGDPKWLQIHQTHGHGKLPTPHTHRPRVHRGPDGKTRSVTRKESGTTADDIREADRRLREGEIRWRRNRKDKGGP